ncbi:MAG: TonB-dependent receptor [Novosphingobium sp.]
MRVTLSASLLLAGASFFAVPAFAAEASDAAADVSGNSRQDTIVVTATKKAEPEALQSVPLAVSVIADEDLAVRKVRALSDLSHAVPGVSLDQVGTFRGVANWSIRGLGINSSIASIDPAVGTFVDGVYIGINPGSALDLFDIAAVEVLRGPQGTLYGRNVTGGAVLLKTADPVEEFHFGVRGSADGPIDGGRGAPNMTMSGYVNVPLADGIAARVAGYHNSDGGWFRNRFNGGDFGKAETNAVRGSVLVRRGPLRVVAKTEYYDTSGDGAPAQNHGLFPRDGYALAINNEGFFRARNRSASVQADLDAGPGKVTYVFGWRKFSQFTSNDIDSGPTHRFHSQTGLRQDQWSHELRWSGEAVAGVDLTVGGFLFQQDIAYDEDRTIPPNPMFFGGGKQDQESQALFAQTDWAVLPRLTLTAGLRWSREEKVADVTFERIRPRCSVLAGTCPVTGTNPSIPGEPNGFSDKRSWSNWSPKLALAWQAADGILAYGGWTRGYRSGGYNLRVTHPAAFLANAEAAGSPAFGAERVDSFEAGVKFASADGRASLNLAAYRTDVAGMQREVSQSDGGSGLAQSVYNTANARIHGIEADARIALTDGLAITGQVAWIDADYRKVSYDISGDGIVDAADRALRLPRVPEWTWGVGVQHSLPLAGHSALETSVRFQHRDRFAYTDNNFGWVGAMDSLDGDVTWRLPVKGWSLSIYGRNLLDDVQFGGDTQIPFGGPLSDGNNRPFDPYPAGGTFSPLAKGRTVGVELAIEY